MNNVSFYDADVCHICPIVANRDTYRESEMISGGQVDVWVLKAADHLAALAVCIDRDLESPGNVRDTNIDRVGRVFVVTHTSSGKVGDGGHIGGEVLCAIVHQSINQRVGPLCGTGNESKELRHELEKEMCRFQ